MSIQKPYLWAAPPLGAVGSASSRRLSHLMVADARWNLFSPGSGWSLAVRIKGARRRRSSHQVPKLLVASDLPAKTSPFRYSHSYQDDGESIDGYFFTKKNVNSLTNLSYSFFFRLVHSLQSFRTLIFVASVACIHGAVVRRSFGSSYGPAPVSSYGAPAAPAPAPAAAPASPPAPSYGSYGVPSVGYGAAPVQTYGPIFYLEEDRVRSNHTPLVQITTEIKSLHRFSAQKNTIIKLC